MIFAAIIIAAGLMGGMIGFACGYTTARRDFGGPRS